jgi:hypothetical protein
MTWLGLINKRRAHLGEVSGQASVGSITCGLPVTTTALASDGCGKQENASRSSGTERATIIISAMHGSNSTILKKWHPPARAFKVQGQQRQRRGAEDYPMNPRHNKAEKIYWKSV